MNIFLIISKCMNIFCITRWILTFIKLSNCVFSYIKILYFDNFKIIGINRQSWKLFFYHVNFNLQVTKKENLDALQLKTSSLFPVKLTQKRKHLAQNLPFVALFSTFAPRLINLQLRANFAELLSFAKN